MFKLTFENLGWNRFAIDLSQELGEICIDLRDMGIIFPLDEIKLKSKLSGIKAKVYSDSDFGKALLKLLDANDTVYDAYVLENTFKHLNVDIKEALECDILNEQYSTKKELYEDIIKMKKSIAPFIESFYCPIICNLENLWNGYSEISGEELLLMRDNISLKLKEEQPPDIDLAEYLSNELGLTDKLKFAEWNITEINGELYGRIDCYVTKKLSDAERRDLMKKIEGQNSDGFGERFEQQPIETKSGIVYVSFWSSSKTYFLCEESQLEESINKRNELKMGGI